MTCISNVKKYKFYIILLFITIIQIITCVFVYDTLKHQENKDIDDFIKKTSIGINSEFDGVLTTIEHISRRNGAIFSINGKKVKPSDFELYTQQNSLPEIVNIGYQRWQARITHDERPDFEAFGDEFIRTNFSVLDVIQIFPELILEPAKNRSEYLTFAISVPEFFGPMGGDSFNISGTSIIDINYAIDNNEPTPSRRTRLFQLNSLINYAIQLRAPVYLANDTTFDRDDLLGLTELLFIPNNILTDILKQLNIKRNDIDIFLYDLSDTINDNESLIYREDKDEYEKYSDRTHINAISNLENSYSNNFNITNRQYSIQLIYSNAYIDNERTFFPEGILIMLCILFVSINIISIIIYNSYINSLKNRSQTIQNNILSNVNHNMRNPLNGIKGVIEIIISSITTLIDDNDNDNYDISKEKFNHIEDKQINISSHELRDDYVNPLIDAYYLTVQLANIIYSADYVTDVILGNTIPEIIEYSLNDIIKHTEYIIRSDIDEHHDIQYSIDVFDTDYIIKTDMDRFCQILIIFVTNAFQYTHEGNISIRVIENDDAIIFNVIDTGIGINPSNVKNLFEYKKTKAHVIGSGGLGLHHAKLIANSINCSVGYTPMENGSNFWVKYPLINNDNNQLNEITEI